MTGVDYLLAQVNIGRMLAPLDSPQLADFAAALDPVNAAADAAPGFNVLALETYGLVKHSCSGTARDP
jgi:hypothetical protein